MESFDGRKSYQDMLVVVRTKLAALPAGSYIRTALPDDQLEEIAKVVESAKLEDLRWGYWPPLFLFLARHSMPEIQSLDSDLDIVIRNSKQKHRQEITQFLNAQPQNDRLWTSGMFETFIKSRLLKEKGFRVELDWSLPNGRNADIHLEMEGRAFCLECTVITESDEDKEVWDRFMVAKKVNEDATLVRPGDFDLPESKGPSPYYDTLRFYAKLYDKLALGLDPRRSQMDEDVPNVLLISFYAPRAPLSATSPGVGWALDELLADQPKSGARLKDHPPGITDISLVAWMNFTAYELHQKSRLDLTRYRNDFPELIAAPRKIGGILLFDWCRLKVSRINYNSNKGCRLSHYEIAALEDLLGGPPVYCHW